MKSAGVVAIVLLILGGTVAGYFIGGSVSRSSDPQAAQLTITGNYDVYSNTVESGLCGLEYSGVGFQFGSGIGNPIISCYAVVGPSQSGTINLNVSNSAATSVNWAFDAVSSNPNMIFFLNPQGCTGFNSVGYCGFLEKNSTASFQLTFLSAPGNYKPINATLDVESGYPFILAVAIKHDSDFRVLVLDADVWLFWMDVTSSLPEITVK